MPKKVSKLNRGMVTIVPPARSVRFIVTCILKMWNIGSTPATTSPAWTYRRGGQPLVR